VGGMAQVKEEIAFKIIRPMQHKELFAAYGKKAGGGILLYGPPGCGKTFIARATAGETGSCFISVGIHEVLNMYIGKSESNLHAIFEYARRNTPAVLFFDEIDAIGASRTDMKTSAGRTLINQLLMELDSDRFSNDGVLVLAATNTPWHMDQALMRPGRFDRLIFVPPPDNDARVAILKVILRDKPIEDIDYQEVAKKTEGFSGADLTGLIDVSIEALLRDVLHSGKQEPLTTRHLMKALKSVKSSTRDWFSTAKNYAVYSNESGIYDDIRKYLSL
jgi:transitional endoplasmic reticulum ATPase